MSKSATTNHEDTAVSPWHRVDCVDPFERDRFAHPGGYVVSITHERQPTQMHDPLDDDCNEGYMATLVDPGADIRHEPLTPRFCSYDAVLETARAFMARHESTEGLELVQRPVGQFRGVD